MMMVLQETGPGAFPAGWFAAAPNQLIDLKEMKLMTGSYPGT